jgi:two-component system cell cycle sensor histidine kinase/response regulator CckA
VSHRRTALLVDDDDTARAGARRMLESLGFHVVAVEDGGKAVEALRSNPDRFSCAILDLCMPGMDGEKCLAALRRLRPNLPVVVTSGSDEEDMAARIALEDSATYLQKPYRRVNLAAKLGELLH